MNYSDQATKLDIRTLMAKALRHGRHARYEAAIHLNKSQAGSAGVVDKEPRKAVMSIMVDWKSGAKGVGYLHVCYPAWDGRIAEQVLPLKGVLDEAGRWRWKLTCPESGEEVQSVYLARGGDRFLSRKAAQIKSRPARSRVERHWRRCEKLMAKLKTTHAGPGITKPKGMSERTYAKLTFELTCADLRYWCAVFKLPPPAVLGDEPLPIRKRELRRHNSSNQYSVFYRDHAGMLQMRARFKRRFDPSAASRPRPHEFDWRAG